MGYTVSVSINCKKAVDFSDLEGASLTVFLEGENLSIMRLTSNSTGWAFDTLDRSHWTETDVGRVKIYATKTGYKDNVVKANYEGCTVDGNDVHNHSFSVDLLMAESDTEVLPPPNIEPVP